jgi:hypothetical protein
LHSDNWSIKGMSDGTMNFGDTKTSGDFTGSSTNTTTTGGLNPFTDSFNPSDVNFGISPTTTDFADGELILRVKNNTGITITSIDVAYAFEYLNNNPRTHTFNFSYSENNTSYTAVTALDDATPQAADGTAFWQSKPKSTTISGLSIPCGSYIYLKWSSVNTGSNGSDELGLDDISLTPKGTVASTCAPDNGGGNGGTGGSTPTGELIITEFASAGTAEWVEIYNTTSSTIDLSSYSITEYKTGTTDLGTLQALSGTIAAGAYVVIVDNGDVAGDFTARWPSFDYSKAIVVTSFGLTGTQDEIILVKDGTTLVDQVDWATTTELNAFTGGSSQGSSTGETASRTNLSGSSDDVANWTLAATGTPGAANTPTGINDASLLDVTVSNNGEGIFTLSETADVILYNVLGSVIFSATNTNTVNISALPSGSYFAIVSKDGKGAVIRLNK